jgi:hypothetical protein
MANILMLLYVFLLLHYVHVSVPKFITGARS